MTKPTIKLTENKTFKGNSSGNAEEVSTAILPQTWDVGKVPAASSTEGTFEWATYCRWRGVSSDEPSTPSGGDIYSNSGDSKTYIYNGTSWTALN